MKRGSGFRDSTLLTAPLLAGTFLLVLGPALSAVAIAFTRYDALSPASFVGLENFRRLASDALFLTSLKNSVIIAAIAVPLRIAIALGLALLLNVDRRFVRSARAATYAPSVVPDIAYALLWLWLLNPIYGPVGIAFRTVAGADLLLSPWGARLSIVLMSLFQIGEVYLVLLAARRELPGELYELCAVEGTSRWWTFRRLTLPFLAPALMFLCARDVALTLQTSFVPSLVVTKGGPGFSTLVLPLYIYQNGFEYLRFGDAAAMTVVMFGATLLMIGASTVSLRLLTGRKDVR